MFKMHYFLEKGGKIFVEW